jgi:hypothetical protein
MKNEELMGSLKEVNQKIDGNKTAEGIEQLNDELLEAVSGGRLGDGSSTKEPYKPREIT